MDQIVVMVVGGSILALITYVGRRCVKKRDGDKSETKKYRKRVDHHGALLVDIQQDQEARKNENTVIIKSLYATMAGLKQLGCNGPVTEAYNELQDFILEERS